MSLFGSLYTGASGMLAHSRSTQVLSNNIANSSTVGYKRSDARFSDLISASAGKTSSALDTIGGVMATPISRIREQGAIQQTSSDTDLSIAGNGFFIVNKTADASGDFVYTRAGQFSPDANGILRNTAGYALYGFLTDENGVSLGTDAASLTAVDLDLLPSQYFETDSVISSINLDAGDDIINPQAAGLSLPVDNYSPNYSRSVTVYDSTGNAQDIKLEFRRITGPMANFTSHVADVFTTQDVLVDDPSGPTDGIVNGDILQISDGTNALDVTFVNGTADTSLNQANTMEDLINVINNYTGSGTTPLFLARLDDDGQFLVQSLDPSATLDITSSSANVLGLNGFNFYQDPDAVPDYTYEPDFDITSTDYASTIYPGQGDMPALADTSDTNPFHWWELTVVHVDPNTGAETNITQGVINFGSDGRLYTSSNGGQNGTDNITLNTADLPFGSTSGIDIDITSITQYSGVYQTLEMSQNGAPETAVSSVDIDDNGLVSLRFESDLSRPVYQLALAMFNNPDGLQSLDGTAFRVGSDGSSGEPEIVLAHTQGAGSVNSFSLEAANVEITDEFGDLIITQRAYSMNAQVVQAVNEMTQTLSNLK